MLTTLSTIPQETLAADYSAKDRTVWAGSHNAYDFFLNGGYLLEIDFRVSNGSKVDIYILSLPEYFNYRDGKPFKSLFTREHTRRVDKDYRNDLEEGTAVRAYLVVDNKDNSRDSDAEPEGSVRYDLEMSHVEKGLPLVEQLLCLGAGITVVVVFAYLFRKRKDSFPSRFDVPAGASVVPWDGY